ncbi:uracil-DNA glycosylase family protein [Bradyrhizobium sp. Gha]|uniref:uracil-DNA glycosylase family protein n=1 Tax=Bradyrhizobium sp. Gha TaxID=1855318 RepID=UPI0008E23CE5|nr:uracil-DNA glycosylase family protein [Bradyrhizobium sp. Gha]SFJ06633.1 uracil-DNA glycosylase, family 4 [Bradyrhizobium sp. Gha]
MINPEKEREFAELASKAKACTLCPRMAESVRVIGPASGSIAAPILIIGEAPGRLGADASAIPFHGDKAGENFETLLEQVGLSRHDCFITNAVLCNPKDENGNNSTPSRSEVNNCSRFLKRQVDLVSPRIVVTLGAQALNAIKSIEPHEIELSSALRKTWNWYGRTLIALYHPGQRAMVHRSFLNQLADYQFLAETFRRTVRQRVALGIAPTSATVAQIAEKLATQPNGISYFALHKLFYLAEYEYYRHNNRRMTSAYIVRQKEGPYVFEMHIKKLSKAIKNLKVWNDRDRLIVKAGGRFDLFALRASNEYDDILKYISDKYANSTDGDLKRIVYLTAPMRQMLRREKKLGESTFNKAIDFSVISTAS